MDKHHKSGKRRTRRIFTPEFKAEAVRLCKVGDRSIARIAMDLDLIETSLREWVRRANIDAGKGPASSLTTDDRGELARLRRENKQLLMEREILKKAAASSTGQCNTFGSTPSKEGGLHGSKRTTRTHDIAEGRVVATVEGRAVTHRHWTRAR